jgi:hypothetical protein
MIKNYTSGVPVDRTISKIEAVLVRGGATNIRKDYADGILVAICFSTVNPVNGQLISVRLPANALGVYDVLRHSIKRPRRGTLEKLREQANRTAWKLMQDWIEVQMSLIAMQQAEFLQVFLPYIWDGNKTFYTALKDSGFKMLTDGSV